MTVDRTVLQPNRRSEGQSYYLSPGADTLTRKRSLVQVQAGPPPPPIWHPPAERRTIVEQRTHRMANAAGAGQEDRSL
jgi:hypothetical protein